MKVIVSRASSRYDEYETDLDISQDLIEQLLNLGGEIPVPEGEGLSWDKGGEKSGSFIINIDPDTKKVELMIYDYYVE